MTKAPEQSPDYAGHCTAIALLRPLSMTKKEQIADKLRAAVMPFVYAGKVLPWITSVYPLDQAQHANADLEPGDTMGKWILDPSAMAEPGVH